MSRSMIKQQNSGATAHVVLYTPRQSTFICGGSEQLQTSLNRRKQQLGCLINVVKMFSLNYVGVIVRHFIVLIFGLNTKKLHFLSFDLRTIMHIVKYLV